MINTVARWRVVYRSPWEHLSLDELQGSIEAARGVLARLEQSEPGSYFVTLWQHRLAELEAELTCPERRRGYRKNGRKNARK